MMVRIMKVALSALLQYVVEQQHLPPSLVTWLKEVMKPVFDITSQDSNVIDGVHTIAVIPINAK